MTKEMEEFRDVTLPLVEWLRENHHPHTSIIITGSNAELVEGRFGYDVEEPREKCSLDDDGNADLDDPMTAMMFNLAKSAVEMGDELEKSGEVNISAEEKKTLEDMRRLVSHIESTSVKNSEVGRYFGSKDEYIDYLKDQLKK